MKEKHLVCQGAICQCLFGSATDTLKVKTQSKRYINDREAKTKLVATHQELGATFENNSFGSCSQKNGNPCTVSVTEWADYYENVTLEDNKGKILLEDSTATCPTGGSGCIKISYHGQQAELSKKNYQRVNSFIAEALNPAGDMETVQESAENIYDAE
ncbi:DUF4280 domain-containing protein [Apibacter raozihei]|uniref:DUF4280 domain-containing protein n=1 Tax=Apibacter raozihei TaxID=2500547 RepID=UPI000FE32A82|nr:DUF4280 domain-containing protein [Apibacter raozihei]